MKDFFIPSERLNVFISSAQRNEGDIDWTEVRRRVKNKLSECRYINPFIIEDVCSGEPSLQLMERQVRESDLVIMLAQSEVRQGTEVEYTAAIKYGISIHAYFIDADNRNKSVDKAINLLQNNDICTYKNLKSINCLEEVVFSDTIEDCIRRFKHLKYISENNEEEKKYSISLHKAHFEGVPTKEAIEEFKGCYQVIPELLGMRRKHETIYEDSSPITQLGIKVQEWLCKGGEFSNSVGEYSLLEYAEKSFAGKWIKDRWKAIDFRLNGNVKKALEYENKALVTAKQEKAPEWIINSILIDCRNLQLQDEDSNKNDYSRENEAQRMLNSTTIPVYMPVLDRYAENAIGELLDEDIELMLKNPNAIRYGYPALHCIDYIQDYLFISLYYGSITHLLISRELLAKSLYKIGKMYNDDKKIRKW